MAARRKWQTQARPQPSCCSHARTAGRSTAASMLLSGCCSRRRCSGRPTPLASPPQLDQAAPTPVCRTSAPKGRAPRRVTLLTQAPPPPFRNAPGSRRDRSSIRETSRPTYSPSGRLGRSTRGRRGRGRCVRPRPPPPSSLAPALTLAFSRGWGRASCSPRVQ